MLLPLCRVPVLQEVAALCAAGHVAARVLTQCMHMRRLPTMPNRLSSQSSFQVSALQPKVHIRPVRCSPKFISGQCAAAQSSFQVSALQPSGHDHAGAAA